MVLGKILGLASALGGRGRAGRRAQGYWAPLGPIKIDATVPAGASTTSGIVATFTVDPKVGSVTEYQLTLNEYWIIDDIYVDAAQGVDGTLVIKKNGVEVARVANVNSLLVGNPQRPRPLATTPVKYGPGDRVGFEFIPASSPAADTAVTVYVAGRKWTVPPTP